MRIALNKKVISISLRKRVKPKLNFTLKLVNYKRIDPENNAIDPPKPPKVDALAVAANVAPSKAYIGNTNAANALKIAAANK